MKLGSLTLAPHHRIVGTRRLLQLDDLLRIEDEDGNVLLRVGADGALEGFPAGTGTGGDSVIAGEVATSASLPVTIGTPAVGTIYLVQTSTGVWPFNRKERGLWRRVANTGDASDWLRLGNFAEALQVYDADLDGVVDLDKGGTGATTASGARAAFGLGDAATKNVGTAGGTVAAGDDTRLTNSRTPTTHANSHASGGSDPLTLAQSQITNLTTDLAGKEPARTAASQAEMEAGTETSIRSMSPQRVAQAIAALGGGGVPLKLCVVSYPFDGFGQNGFSVTNSAFTKVPFNTVSVDQGSCWDSTNKYYVVPATGVYVVITKLRPEGNVTGGKGYGQGADTALQDSASFAWFTTATASVNRHGSLNIRVGSFTAGDHIMMVYYADSIGTTTAQAEMTIYRVA